MEPAATTSKTSDYAFLPHGEDMTTLIRNKNWSGTPLGNPAAWPSLLHSTLATMLHTRLPMFLFWGEDLICLYNDACRSLLNKGSSQPDLLGSRAAEIWPERLALLKEAVSHGASGSFEDRLWPATGYAEHNYWHVSYSPVQDNQGQTRGVLLICSKTVSKASGFQNLISQITSPVLILRQADLQIAEANQAALDLWQLDHSAVGRPLASVLPEEGKTVLIHAMEQVYRTGETTVSYEVPCAARLSDGTRIIRYWNFEHSACREAGGLIGGVLVLAYDVTGQVLDRRRLRQSEARLELAIEGGELGTYDFDIQTGALYWSERTRSLFGLPPDAAVNYQTFINGIHPDDVQDTEAAAQAAMDPANGRCDHVYRTVGLKDGQVRWLRTKGQVSFEGNKPLRFAGIVQDITSQKTTEQALHEARANAEKQKRLYEAVTGSTPDLIYVFDLNYRFTYANKALLEMWGRSWDEAIGKGMPDLGYEPWHAEMHMREIDQVVATGQPVRGEVSFPHAVLGRRMYDYIFTPVINNRGEVEAVAGTTRDITELKQVEEKVKASEERFRTLANEAPAFIFMGNANAQLDFVSRSWLEFTGLTEDEGLELGWTKVTHPDDVALSFETYKKGVATRTSYQYEIRQFCKADGRYHWVLWRGVPRFLPGGEFAGMMGIGVDITENKLATEALQQSETRYRALAETLRKLSVEQKVALAQLESLLKNAPVGFVFFDRNYRFVRLNDVIADINGVPLKEHAGKTMQEVVPDVARTVMPLLDQVIATRQPITNIEVQGETPRMPGVTRYWLTGYYPILNEAGNEVEFIGVVVMEITDRRLAEKKRQESERRFRMLADALPQMVWMSDRNGNTEFASRRWAEYSGIENVQEAWNAMVHPDDTAAMYEQWEQARREGLPYRYEVRLKNKEGEYRWHSSVAEPLFDDNGNILNWVGTLTDIQVQKSFSENLERLVVKRTEELQRSNEDLQQFAHVASHDLKEPVRKIKTFISMLNNSYADALPEPAKLYLSKIDGAAARMYAMIDGVLLYSSLDAIEQAAERTDLNALLHSIEDDLEVLIVQKGASIRYGQLLFVKGIRILLYQLLYNLVSNSLKFSRPGQPPLIDISTVLHTNEEGQQFVQLTLRDNGVGFNPKESERIFKTFTRLHPKDHFEGTGLGLALCRKIVERHNGHISATGKEGEGATFTILLPA